MPPRKYSVEQIVARLIEAERLQGQELSIAQVCKRLGDLRSDLVPVAAEDGALKEDEAQTLKAWSRRTPGLRRSWPIRPWGSPCSRTSSGGNW
jgi:hypothetical protein